MENRFHKDNVASTGTYVTLQLKAAFQEMCRLMGVLDPGTRNYMSVLLDDYSTWEDLFIAATENDQIKKFIDNNGDLVNNMRLCLGTPKSTSVHACAVIVVPNKNKLGGSTSIYKQIPVRKDKSGILVTEWEGPMLEDAGFLKQDILGVKQLDKFSMVFDLVKESTGEDLYTSWREQTIPIDDINVYKAFWEGHTADVFQFSGSGMTSLMKELMPDNIEDLIAANALYRPGPMGSNAHKDYCKLKNGQKDRVYYKGTEGILKATYGLLVYQEQVMRICVEVGGFTMIDAEGIRKAIGKKIMSKMKSYGEQFKKGAIAKYNYTIDEANQLWADIEIFGQYSFNKSHAAAYAKTAYWCQYLKVHYPIQFWTAALTNTEEKKIPKFVGEILSQKSISILPPDINKSERTFITDTDTNEIFWSIEKIKGAGAVAVEKILKERDEGGSFFSIDEFVNRTGVNKTVVVALIMSGSFDKIYDITNPKQRLKLLKEYFEIRKDKFPEKYMIDDVKYEWYWYLQQKATCGLASISSWLRIMNKENTPNTMSMQNMLVSPQEFHSDRSVGKNVLISGFISDIDERKTKKGDKYARVTIDNNYTEIKLTVWSDCYVDEDFKEHLHKAKGKLIFVNGRVSPPDRFNDCNTISTIGSKLTANKKHVSKIDIVG